MHGLCENAYDKAIVVANDGDYYPAVEYLLGKNKLGKVLLPDESMANKLYQ